jgi:hypothetical protein
VVTGTEREVLEGFLELHRGLLPGKLAGLGEDEVRRSLVPSRTTLIGLLKHLASGGQRIAWSGSTALATVDR